MSTDRLDELSRRQLCFNCEKFKWKNAEIQVCSGCYTHCNRHKCLHCKEEFSSHKYCQKAQKNYNKIVCMKCANSLAISSSEPALCRFCACWSAWNGKGECQRCEKSLNKFGVPKNCERCGKNSAFDRGPESRSKVGHLFLCYLCTFEYKKNEYYKNKLLGNNNSNIPSTRTNTATDTSDQKIDPIVHKDLKDKLKTKDCELETLRNEIATLELRYKSDTDNLKRQLSSASDQLRQVMNEFNNYKQTQSADHMKIIREKQSYIDDLNIAFAELRQKHEALLLANAQLAKTIESFHESPRKVAKK